MSLYKDQAARAQRLERLWVLLQRHAGLSEAELAEMLQIERRTLNNYLRELENEGKVYKEGRLWFAYHYQETRLRAFDLTPEEAMTLYLGARLLVKQYDRRNEPAETALLKLAQVLKSDAGIGDEILQAAQELARRPVSEGYQPVFRTLMRGYVYRKQVAIEYQPLRGQPFSTHFAIYLIEPSPVGYATYLIGHSQVSNALRAYKLERVLSARLTDIGYCIPEDFNGLEMLQHAWSIVMGEERVQVVVRFSPRVRKRVLETIWHPSQVTEEDAEHPGSLIWKVTVADTLDLLPWLRSWGADAEVLEPERLREALIHEAMQLTKVYNMAQRSPVAKSFYAHSKAEVDESGWQLLKDHLLATGDLAYELGRDAGISDLARVAGILHDIGKYSQAFQERLRGSRRPVDHATAGAREVIKLFPGNPYAELLSYCIAGHHSGLPDYGDPTDLPDASTLLARRDKKSLQDYSAYRNEIDHRSFNLRMAPLRPIPGHSRFTLSFLVRMIFSTLVDADWMETERYMLGGLLPRGGHETLDQLLQRFKAYLRRYENPEGEVNLKRSETLKACIASASMQPGFFTLTVPTGGGKTLASMAFALNHAVHHAMKRIIYVIPFTSIIEQNAAIFKDALGEENVLEHHSNFDWDNLRRGAQDADNDDETNVVYDKLKLACENWDIPIVVTTNVQFFESLFANKKSRSRKVHNIAKSVIIFDEAQMLPREYLKPCLLAVQELVTNYGASAVFCTATQPDLSHYLQGVAMTELAPDPQALFDFYRRVEIKQAGKMTDLELAERLNAHPQVVCVVNTRRHAKAVFDLLEESRYHLSTLMCPVHRKLVLATIRRRLQSGEICRVVSTQVIEAGVDLDFPVGYRALAGLDSLIQVAGRVNREKRNFSGSLYVFEADSEAIKRTPGYIAQTAQAGASILRQFSTDPTSLQAIAAYFQQLDTLQDINRQSDVKNILAYLDKDHFEFARAGEKFRLIESPTIPVIIPYDDRAEELLNALRFSPYPAGFARRLQPYSVSIYQGEFEALQAKGAIDTYHDIFHVLNDMTYYNEQAGLALLADRGGEAIFMD
jgi:CRISPR-associated endonuclease/helicase Cas3